MKTKVALFVSCFRPCSLPAATPVVPINLPISGTLGDTTAVDALKSQNKGGAVGLTGR